MVVTYKWPTWLAGASLETVRQSHDLGRLRITWLVRSSPKVAAPLPWGQWVVGGPAGAMLLARGLPTAHPLFK